MRSWERCNLLLSGCKYWEWKKCVSWFPIQFNLSDPLTDWVVKSFKMQPKLAFNQFCRKQNKTTDWKGNLTLPLLQYKFGGWPSRICSLKWTQLRIRCKCIEVLNMCRPSSLAFLFLIYPLLSTFCDTVNTTTPDPVCIKDGCIQGIIQDGNKKEYEAWYGIPFAEPPIGEMRFRVNLSSNYTRTDTKMYSIPSFRVPNAKTVGRKCSTPLIPEVLVSKTIP